MKHEDRRKLKLLSGTLTVLLFFVVLTITSAQTTEQLAEKALAATVYLEVKDSTGETTVSAETYFMRGNVRYDVGDYRGAIAAYREWHPSQT